MRLFKFYLYSFLILFSIQLKSLSAQTSSIKVTTWNIEHLGTDGRGFGGGFGSGNLSLRTDDQLKNIGKFIRDKVKSDVVALQEIGISHESNNESRSIELDKTK